MGHKLYLTIDDSPSRYTEEKVNFLHQQNIPAIFFCRGEFISSQREAVIRAIQKGFLVGNHSYSHPYFSQIPLSSCFEEILKTETQIDVCYHLAQVVRRTKVIRLPFGDRGAGADAAIAGTSAALDHVQAIQNFLKAEGFAKLSFNPSQNDSFIDVSWTWAPRDYKRHFIDDEESYCSTLKTYLASPPLLSDVLVLHDFDYNHHLFEVTMDVLKENGVVFMSGL